MSKIELDVLFKKMQKDDKKEVLEFHIIDDEVPHSNELIQMAGSMTVLTIGEHENLTAEFKKIQRDSKKTVLQFETKGDNEEKLIKLYKLAGSHVKLELEPSQMSIDEFYDADEQDRGLEYTVEHSGPVVVAKGQLSTDDIPIGVDDEEDHTEDEDDLLN